MNRREWWRYSAAAATGGLLAASNQAVHAEPSPGSLHAVWVHGTSFTVEDETALEGVDRRGWGILFRGRSGAATWLHVSIPAPVIIENQRPLLEKVMVLFNTSAFVEAVHVWDGSRQVKAFENLHLQGDWTRLFERNSWALTPQTIYFGLGVSIAVRFSTLLAPPAGIPVTNSHPIPERVVGESDVPVNSVLFTAAGADFRIRSTIPGGVNPPIPNPFFDHR